MRGKTLDALRRFALPAWVVLASHAAAGQDAPDPWKPIGEILGKAGELSKDGTYKVTVLRTDVAVKGRMGLAIPTAMGLNSYAAFVGTPEDATAVGDTCCLEHEIDPVIDALRAGGIEVVALHNHMTIESPRLFFMHFQARGNAATVAKTIRAAWACLGKPSPPPPEIPAGATAVEPDWMEVSRILGRDGPPAKDGVYKVTLPRDDLGAHIAFGIRATPWPGGGGISYDGGHGLAPGAGLACWSAFYACACGRTMVMGDTCVTRKELGMALDALRRGGIHVTGIHNHFFGVMGVEGLGFTQEAVRVEGTLSSGPPLRPVGEPLPLRLPGTGREESECPVRRPRREGRDRGRHRLRGWQVGPRDARPGRN